MIGRGMITRYRALAHVGSMTYHRCNIQPQRLPAMHNRAFPAILSIVLLPIVLLAPGGCGVIGKEKSKNAKESALTAYENAIRWGYFEAAYSYVHPKKRKEVPKELENIRITGYEVVKPPLVKGQMKGKKKGGMGGKMELEQTVRIEYVQKDVQLLRSVTDRQKWSYDKENNVWWLESGVPEFK